MKDFGLLITSLLVVWCIFDLSNAEVEAGKRTRDGKLLPVFQVVKFPNDPCTVSGSKNGTCYTAEECSSKGGVKGGDCASAFGVCCIFTMTCGSTSSENITYFDSATSVNEGACRAKICKCSTNICQIRLDFDSFVLTGPSTTSTSIQLQLGGQALAGGKKVASATQCLTDIFTVTEQDTIPVLCGTNSGFHAYFEASDNCNYLDFQLGNNAVGVSAAATRKWSIKITQYACDFENKAPTGCTQWHYGSGGTNYVQTFNYQSGSGRHLANQQQVICIRRESGNCRVCWSADAANDVKVSGKTNIAAGVILGTMCCQYGTDGNKIATAGYDCLQIPGAAKAAAPSTAVAPKLCGTKMGLVTAAGVAQVTICSAHLPFRISFISDNTETAETGAAGDESAGGNTGFKLRYYQTSC